HVDGSRRLGRPRRRCLRRSFISNAVDAGAEPRCSSCTTAPPGRRAATAVSTLRLERPTPTLPAAANTDGRASGDSMGTPWGRESKTALLMPYTRSKVVEAPGIEPVVGALSDK